MRRNNFSEMTVVEQIAVIREEICEYACKYYEAPDKKSYCEGCPMQSLDYKGDEA